MKSGSHFAPRSLLLASDAGRHAPGTGSGADAESSFGWKGWSNSGGDRASTAAQFSRLSEHPALPLATSGQGASPATVRVAAPAYPTNEAALLAPVNAAIERLITRGQDQLSVIVRFEQGGSLSLKLTMRDGGIATHMETNLPGLEATLRSAWTTFAQDWNQRGVKLAAPSFGAGTSADLTAGRDGQHHPQQEGQGFTGEAPLFGAMAGRGSLRGIRHPDAGSSRGAAAGKSSRARPAQRGLSTWA